MWQDQQAVFYIKTCVQNIKNFRIGKCGLFILQKKPLVKQRAVCEQTLRAEALESTATLCQVSNCSFYVGNYFLEGTGCCTLQLYIRCYQYREEKVGGKMWEVFKNIVHFGCVHRRACGCMNVGFAPGKEKKT